MSDYERVARIIRYLDERHADQPDLDTLAKHVGLSRHHFHRLFTSWAGITPKDFLQCLTMAHAKQLLQNGKSVLDVAVDTGLSSPSRLHDLSVTLSAASPGEIKSGGKGWTISAGFSDSPFGRCLIAESPRGICHISFEERDNNAALVELRKQWLQAKINQDDEIARRLADHVFHKKPIKDSSVPLRAFVRGTPFQIRVWKALLEVKKGTLTSYGRLAAAIKYPTAARAVGTAVGQNPLVYLIPCHRVIRETGVLGNYHWGQDRKKAMYAWENASKGGA